MSLLDYTFAPVITFKRAIQRQPESSDSRQGVKAIFDLPVESGDAIDGVSGPRRIEVKNIAVGRGDAEVLVFQVG